MPTPTLRSQLLAQQQQGQQDSSGLNNPTETAMVKRMTEAVQGTLSSTLKDMMHQMKTQGDVMTAISHQFTNQQAATTHLQQQQQQLNERLQNQERDFQTQMNDMRNTLNSIMRKFSPSDEAEYDPEEKNDG